MGWMMMIFIQRIPQQGLNPGRGGLHKQHYLKWQTTMPTQNLLQKKWEEEEEAGEEEKKKKTWKAKRRTHKKELQVVLGVCS